MTFWLNKINWGKVLLSSIVFTVAALVIRQIEALITMKYYLMPQYFGVWSKIMMPVAGPPPASYYITSVIITFVTGLSIALIYYYMKDHLPVVGIKRIVYFTEVLMAAFFIFFTLPVYLMFNIPIALLISWFISTFIILIVGSFILVKIVK